tara:strand:+ start:5073 stop:6383 length:1311 start_codon:yes stop_codon:yes gene_type:complete
MKRNVLMVAPFNTRSGYGDHARSIFYSIMDREDLDIKCLDVKWGNTPRNHLRPEVPRHKRLLDTFVSQDRIQGQPDVLIDIRIPNEFATGAKVNIGITAGVETDVVSPAFLEGMNRMNFNLVPSKFTADTFNRCIFDKMEDLPNGQKKKVGEIKNEKPLAVLFEGIDTDVYYPKDKYQTKKDDPILYDELDKLIVEDFAYLHVGQWGNQGFGEDRKNIGVLIKSFLKSFSNVPNPPALVLKTNGANFSVLDREETKKKIQQVKDMFKGVNLPNIYLIHGDFTIEEMSTLYNHPKIGVFITCTHGEGFGRPMLEASCCDLPVIASKWSGHMDFLTDSESMLIDGFLKEVPKSVLWENIIVEPSKWFDVNEADVVRKIRTFHKKRKLIQKKAVRLGKKNRREFSLKAMADKFNKIIDDLLKEIPEPVSLKLPKLKKVT